MGTVPLWISVFIWNIQEIGIGLTAGGWLFFV